MSIISDFSHSCWAFQYFDLLLASSNVKLFLFGRALSLFCTPHFFEGAFLRCCLNVSIHLKSMNWASSEICDVLSHHLFAQFGLSLSRSELCSCRLACRAWEPIVPRPPVFLNGTTVFADGSLVIPRGCAQIFLIAFPGVESLFSQLAHDSALKSLILKGVWEPTPLRLDALRLGLQHNRFLKKITLDMGIKSSVPFFDAICESFRDRTSDIRLTRHGGFELTVHTYECFKSVPALRKLVCSPTRNEHVLVLSRMISTLPSLTKLDVSWGEFDRYYVLELADALRANTSLASLRFEGLEGDISFLASVLHPNAAATKISLSGTFGESFEDFVEAIRHSTTLQALRIFDGSMGTSSMLHLAYSIRANKSLKKFYWENIEPLDIRAPSAAGLLSLGISDSPSLTEVWLSSTSATDPCYGLLDYASRMTRLEKLSVTRDEIGHFAQDYVLKLADLVALSSSLKSLVVDTNLPDANLIRAACASQHLREFDLGTNADCKELNNAAEALAGNQSLRRARIYLRQKYFPTFALSLSRNTSLLSLYLGLAPHEDLRYQSQFNLLPELSKCLPLNRTLETLDLSSLFFDFAEAKELAAAINHSNVKRVAVYIPAPTFPAAAETASRPRCLRDFHGGACLANYLDIYEERISPWMPPGIPVGLFSNVCPCSRPAFSPCK